MSRRSLPVFLILALACLGPHPARATEPACAAVDGWNAGRAGQPADAACKTDAYLEAHRLGEALAELRSEREAIDTRIAAGTEDAGVLRRRQRQIDVDVEAIQGVAVLHAWPQDRPVALPTGDQP